MDVFIGVIVASSGINGGCLEIMILCVLDRVHPLFKNLICSVVSIIILPVRIY